MPNRRRDSLMPIILIVILIVIAAYAGFGYAVMIVMERNALKADLAIAEAERSACQGTIRTIIAR